MRATLLLLSLALLSPLSGCVALAGIEEGSPRPQGNSAGQGGAGQGGASGSAPAPGGAGGAGEGGDRKSVV